MANAGEVGVAVGAGSAELEGAGVGEAGAPFARPSRLLPRAGGALSSAAGEATGMVDGGVALLLPPVIGIVV